MKRDKWFANKAFIFFFFVCASSMLSCSGSEERESKYLQRAESYFNENNFQKAKVEVKNVLQINPKNSKARVLLGRLNQKDGDYRQAISNFNTAAEEDPKQVDARIEMAKIYLSASKDAEATRYIKEALLIEPGNKESQAIMAGLYMRAGDRDNAIKLAKDILSDGSGNVQAIAVLTAIYIDSDPELALTNINNGLAVDVKSTPLKMLKIEVLKRANRFNEVEDIYRDLIKENPKTLNFYDKLAGYYTLQGKIDEAENVVRQAINNNPESVEPILALVNFTKKVRSSEKSEAMLKEFIAKKPDIYALKQVLAEQYFQENKKYEAINLLNSVIESNKSSQESLKARVDIAKFYLIDKDKEKASALLDEVFAIEQSNSEARILSARIKLNENKTKDAIADLRTVLKNDEKSLEAYKLLAFAQEKDGAPELALDSYFRALDIDSQDIPALFGAARLSISNQKKDTGKKLLERILTINSDSTEATVLLANLMVGDKDWSSAEKLGKKLIDSSSEVNKATGYDLLGGIYSAQEKWDLAKQYYEKSLNISPTSYSPLAGLVNAQLAENKLSESITFIENHVKKYQNFNKAKNILANLYIKDKKFKSAIDIYESLIPVEPKNENLYQGLAAIYFEQKDLNRAEDVYLRGLAAIPDSVSIRAYLGNLYTFDKQYTKAKEQYEIANAKMPDSDMIKNNLAILLINYLPSEQNLRKALDLTLGFSSSKEPNYLDTLGWVHYQAGNTPQAISFLQQAVRLKSSPEFRYHLGMAYQKSRQTGDAKKELELAIRDADSNSGWLDEAKKTLANN